MFWKNSQSKKLLMPFLVGVISFSILNMALTGLMVLSPSVEDFLDSKIPNKLTRKFAEMGQEQTWDILAMGSSITDSGFHPAIFEKSLSKPYKSFNIGLPGARYDVMETYLRYHVKHHKKPKLVVIEATDFLFNPQDDHYYMACQYYLKLIGREPEILGQVLSNDAVNFNDKREIVLSSLSGLYRYRPVLSPVNFERKALKSLKYHVGKLSASPVSAAPVPKETAPVTNTPPDPTTLPWFQGWTFRPENPLMSSPTWVEKNAEYVKGTYIDTMKKVDEEQLAHLLDYCRQENIPAVIVHWPDHPGYRERFQAAPHAKTFQKTLVQVSQRYNTPLIDLEAESSRLGPKSWENLYTDVRHMNARGASFYSQLLAEKLSVSGVLK